MTSAKLQLLDLIHAIACRAIRHDTKVPLDHVQNFCGFINETLSRRKDIFLSVKNPSELMGYLGSIPEQAEQIDERVSALEETLKTRADYSGEASRSFLLDLIQNFCVPMENSALRMRDLFEGADPEVASHARKVANNAIAAKARLRALVEFFRDDFVGGSAIEVDLRADAETAARNVSRSNRAFERVFRFDGEASTFGSRTLLQAIFQNIYQNGLRYGAVTRGLEIKTRFSEGSFSQLTSGLTNIAERPGAIDSRWVRVDFANNGPPFPINKVNHIFRLGNKFPVPGVVVEDSHGIGMAICFASATLHRGTMIAVQPPEGVLLHLLVPKEQRFGFTDPQLRNIAESLGII